MRGEEYFSRKEKNSRAGWNVSVPPELGITNLDDLVHIKLSCDCPCQNCRDIYISYIQEKAANRVLEGHISSGQIEMEQIIERVKQSEDEHKRELKCANELLVIERARYAELEATLTQERQLRMEDVYKAEQARAETEYLSSQTKELHADFIAAFQRAEEAENRSVSLQNVLDKLMSSGKRNENLLHSYESEIARLELLNNQLRLRLSEYEAYSAQTQSQPTATCAKSKKTKGMPVGLTTGKIRLRPL